MSFQYRDKEDKDLLAFVSLGKERIPINPTELEGCNIENGCRILMAQVRKIVKWGKWLTTDISLLYTLLEEMELRITMWCDTNNNNNRKKKGGERFAALMEHALNVVTFEEVKVVKCAA